MTKRDKEYVRKIKAGIRAEVRQHKKEKFEATTLEQRKNFVSALHSGKNLGQACKAVGFDTETGLIVWGKNRKLVKHYYLLPVEEVK